MNDLITVGINRNVKGFPILRLILPQEILQLLWIMCLSRYLILHFLRD